MANRTYSTYEAKTRFSEVLRHVRERGETITVTYHGEPVAEIRPVTRVDGDPFRARLRRLEGRGALARPDQGEEEPVELRRVARRQGALQRFLADREP